MLKQSRGWGTEVSDFTPHKRSERRPESRCEVALDRLENRHFGRKTLSSLFAPFLQFISAGIRAEPRG